jgi:hypothetical protein
VAITDCHTGVWQDVGAAQVAVAAGSRTDRVLARAMGTIPEPRVESCHTVAFNLALGRRPADAATGIRSGCPAAGELIGGGRRFLFLAPQEETTLLDDVNRAYPNLGLTRSEINGRQWGRLPFEAGREERAGHLADRAPLTGFELAGEAVP